MQTKTPRFHDAHLGCFVFLQSAQDLFPFNFNRVLMAAAFWAPLSGGPFVLLDMMQ